MKLIEDIKKGIACDSVGKPHSPIGRAVCLSVHPGKMLLFPFVHWFHFHYKNRYKFARLMFSIDLLLIGIILTLGVIAIYANFFRPGVFEKHITLEATVAPREVTTGAPSTLVIEYSNNTDEDLMEAEFSLTPPKHFLTQTETHFSLGTIPSHTSGNVHIKGVMFGDVGGEQAFMSKLIFVHGTNRRGEKTNLHVFSPTRSALSLSLELPDHLIAYQPITGIVRYENKSDIDFPIVNLLPQWPNEFDFIRADHPMRNGQFEIPIVKAGEHGEFRFEGTLEESSKEVTFVFHPSFTFGDERYKQETLMHTASLVRLPIELTHHLDTKTLQPGSQVTFVIDYKNTTDFPVSDVSFVMESDHSFLKIKDHKKIDVIKAREEGSITLTETIRPSLSQNESTVYDHILINTRPKAEYTFGDTTTQRVTSKGSQVASRLNSPIRFESFARYKTETGDQIGRGPMPPEIGEETTYWVFWHIDGTTNELKNVRVEGTLPDGVRFTGRQTVSQNGVVEFDEKTRSVLWKSSFISPTLPPTSKTIGVAFEVGIIPTISSVSSLPLLKNIRLTATDDWTGAFVSASAKEIKVIVIN